MQQNVHFWLGSDPELMLRDIKSKQLKSAIPIIVEGKGAGKALDAPGDNFVLHDNVLVEFNTEPADKRDNFVKTLGEVLSNIDTIVRKDGLELWLQTSADFPESELRLPEAREFGCEPDYNAYTVERNEMPADAADKSFRSAGGHLHIGIHKKSPKLAAILDDPHGKMIVVKALDIFVGIISVFLDKDPTAAARRSLYGKAGSHRPKDYGVEYRASGNWWLASPKHAELVHRLSKVALTLVLDKDKMEEVTKNLGGESSIQKVINNSEVLNSIKMYAKHLVSFLDKDTKKLVEELNAAKTTVFRESWNFS